MAGPAVVEHEPADSAFVHEAFFYRTLDEYVAGTARFIADGLAAGEPVMVMIAADKWAALCRALARPDRILFEDMRVAGQNPSRIIAAWNDFVTAHPGTRLRGIGEPIWPERTEPELVEAHRHEALLNAAFAGAPMSLLCPYDVTHLDDDVITQAALNHPYLLEGGVRLPSPSYHRPDPVALLSGDPLPPRPADAVVLEFDGTDLPGLRRFIRSAMGAAGLDRRTVDAIELVVGELAGNSIRHGGGAATIAVWRDADEVVIDVTDAGTISNALVGRLRPSLEMTTGRGLYIVNHCADLVELRSRPERTTVRAHFRV